MMDRPVSSCMVEAEDISSASAFDFLCIVCIIHLMNIDKSQVSFKLWETTRELLKVASALNSESMTEMIHRLIAAEYKRVVENFDRQEGIQVQTKTE